MELALSTILVSCFTCVGLLALLAATSDRHWFLRMATFLAAISLTLLIPAYEVFVAFAIQGLVAANCLAAYRWLVHGYRPNLSRYRLADLLLAMLILSLLFAVRAHLPELNRLAWTNVVMIGGVAGLATCIGGWIGCGSILRVWARGLCGLAVATLLALALLPNDWFFISMVSQGLAVSWPPEPTPGSINGIFGGPQEDDIMWSWVGVTAATALLIGLGACLATAISDAAKSRTALWGIVAVFALLIANPAVVTFYLLATPLPIPHVDPLDENGYEQLVAAGNIAENWDFNATLDGYDAATPQQLEAAVVKMAPAYELLAAGLAKPTRIPIDYESVDSLDVLEITKLRNLARICGGRGRLAQVEGRTDDAVNSYLDAIRLGAALRQDALMVHALVGFGCAGTGMRGLYEVREELTVERCRQAIAELERLELRPGEAEGFLDRDHIWTQHAMGWHGRLTQLLSDFCEPDWGFSDSGFIGSCQQYNAENALLRTELALAAFYREHETYPAQLAGLVPTYLAQTPVDPFNHNGQALPYRAKQDGYVLYSLGRDRDDDGGDEESDDSELDSNFWYAEGGDLRLSIRYTPDPPVNEDYNEDDDYGFGTGQE
ncbi:MAG: hypothetical protein AAGD11_06460 [Planctomycetota bacterium]